MANCMKVRKFITDLTPVSVVKLLAKSKLKSLPYNHTDHPPTHPLTHPATPNFKSSLYKSIQVLHQHMRYH